MSDTSESIDKISVICEAMFLCLYETSLSIDGGKYKHLQELKATIPKDYHSFYDNLKYCNKPK